MKINGKPYRTIWPCADESVEVIDQIALPHRFQTQNLRTMEDCARAIKTMVVRGAPLIGATAAYGMALAMREDPSSRNLVAAYDMLLATRPTAVNLRWALTRMGDLLQPCGHGERFALAWAEAARICDEDVAICRSIGEHGLRIFRDIAARKGGKLDVLTHCNAGWLACVDWGTALSPIYMAFDEGIDVHVWVDETRPRNQGASLTAFELGAHGVKHSIIADNAGGHYMRAGEVDVCIVGTDRVTANGDVANKIGTYLKALAAKDNDVPFYVALPSTTIDWTLDSGTDIPIEERSGGEVLKMTGRSNGDIVTVDIAAPGSPARNPAFDVTPARLVTGLVTEAGVCEASAAGLNGLFPHART